LGRSLILPSEPPHRLEERLRYLRDLDERRAAILDSISQQGKTRLVAVPDAADVVWRH
jgi:transcriptional accessory protein Tex/SPT6